MQRKCLTFLALTVIALPAWAVNKCTGSDGKVIYQETACDNAQKTETVTIKPTAAPTSSEAYGAMLERRLSEAKKACGMADLPSLPEIGWSEDKFMRCSKIGVVGSVKVNTTETSAGVSKQFVFRVSEVYVYTVNGTVTAVQK